MTKERITNKARPRSLRDRPLVSIVVKPSGPGNWHSYVINCSRKPDLFTLNAGDIITMGPWKFRVVEVRL